ncbi:MAG TPA: hypothetical protein PL151_17450 [Phycisphaerae bacterium]|nr:hypothetical protein [Phycisphaerae bacterium]HOJ74986.1 hypothetical protein [Phycisphaerae bacterium]HOM51547.1 hypothetical protein [Phycisphaerae bacterium]HON68892.1 hypothetical protein [Phycisphaerae bacterium]HOQ85459.1 hypothetical protein [Phycisphaerae bacterium]
MKRILILGAIVVVATGGVLAVVSRFMGPPSSRVDYPYVCRDCKAVFPLAEIKADYRNYRVPKGAPSDSIVHCLRCNKGWAFPVTKCEVCGTERILYLCKDTRCPKCFPEAAEAARKEGVNVLFQQP